ncbi:hypothetical protein PMZ80_011112 [Knufia obscura]|uniref:Glycosyltransferase family 25 protein n=1 Tax=Knufia obscura TaxID=1635080 RepID=A0ABR0R7P7_9EURO|nr:hypothetical protein PMZ80_011112 [Knufia obscura]
MSVARLSGSSNKNVRNIGGGVVLLLVFVLLLAFNFGSTPVSGIPTKPAARDALLQNILNTTLGFERILVINLPERTDHHDGMVLAGDVTGLHIEFVPGIRGEAVADKVLPAHFDTNLGAAQRGSWRAHINSISRVIENGWSSALIMEDDIDWDVRLKQQLQDVAVASRYLTSNPTSTGRVQMKDARHSTRSTHSPYGDDWDILWLGHCGMKFPETNAAVLYQNDNTVAPIKYQESWDANEPSPLKDLPEHTRVYTTVSEGVCSLAYAVSQQGARKLLFALGLRRLTMPFDLMLREWCQGNTEVPGYLPKCISVLPQLFDHHRRVGPKDFDSEIADPNGLYRDQRYTLNIRQSVRMNMEKLLSGRTDFEDQWPD